ncbi:translation initiation factor IF-2-like isoform X5 [Oxyura jamaicensis]|uniref:translation initiation factor IF-2-like isoform X5 n=1 Tax=Oxyura jamaicensis TaxID=8884 RepID=UPI0015A7080C|nr:translation initiation factor IF-2-like isoform X5 [Oxyura jamaicensis]XP_035170504.1 translation initiation factor IF-2-like isoform X5 [Oxyura jamaicensis]
MPRGRAWTQAEVGSLLALVGGSGEAALLMASTSRPNEALWQEISRGLAAAGYGRSVAQCRSKWKALKQAFHSERETRRRAGRHSARLPPHYRAMKSIWKAAGRPVFGERRLPELVKPPPRRRRSLAARSPAPPAAAETPAVLLAPLLQRPKDEPESPGIGAAGRTRRNTSPKTGAEKGPAPGKARLLLHSPPPGPAGAGERTPASRPASAPGNYVVSPNSPCSFKWMWDSPSLPVLICCVAWLRAATQLLPSSPEVAALQWWTPRLLSALSLQPAGTASVEHRPTPRPPHAPAAASLPIPSRVSTVPRPPSSCPHGAGATPGDRCSPAGCHGALKEESAEQKAGESAPSPPHRAAGTG